MTLSPCLTQTRPRSETRLDITATFHLPCSPCLLPLILQSGPGFSTTVDSSGCSSDKTYHQALPSRLPRVPQQVWCKVLMENEWSWTKCHETNITELCQQREPALVTGFFCLYKTSMGSPPWRTLPCHRNWWVREKDGWNAIQSSSNHWPFYSWCPNYLWMLSLSFKHFFYHKKKNCVGCPMSFVENCGC